MPEIAQDEKNSQQLESNQPHLSLDASQSEEKSRRFSQIPPASSTSPNAVKMGHFAVIPTSDSNNESMPTISITTNNLDDDSNNLQLNENEEKSRRFSQLPPVANDD